MKIKEKRAYFKTRKVALQFFRACYNRPGYSILDHGFMAMSAVKNGFVIRWGHTIPENNYC